MNWLRTIVFTICPVCKPKQSRTVRYAFPLIVATVAFLGAQALTSSNESAIIVEPSTNALRAGEPFYLKVLVSAKTPINAVNLELAFPQDQIKVTGIDTGESVITLWTQEPYVKSNTVYISGGTFRRGFIGQHQLATINAKAVATGIANIKVTNFQLLAGDGSGTAVKVAQNSDFDTKLYVANEDGSYQPGTEPVKLTGRVEISIETDIDGDGDVSLADVSRFMSAWFTKGELFDFNSDGQMTFRDFGIILSDSFFR